MLAKKEPSNAVQQLGIKAVLASILALPIVFCLALFLIAPGKQLPFNFVDGLYPPRVAEMETVKAKKTALEDKAAAEKAKAKKAALDKKAADEAAAAKAAAPKAK